MLKYILSPILILSTPAMPASPETVMQAMINMASASYYCDMKIPDEIAYSFLEEISGITGYSKEYIAIAVDKKAKEFGSQASAKQMLKFCAVMGERYAKAGISLD